MDGWLGVVIMIVLGVGFAAVMIGLSVLLGPKNPTPEKLAPYECGMPAVGDARERHSVKFYLVAMIFLLFDIEIAFLYPWAMALRDLGWAGLLPDRHVLPDSLVGYVYVWRKGCWTGVRPRASRAAGAPQRGRVIHGPANPHEHGLDPELPISPRRSKSSCSGRASRPSGRRSSASPAAPSR